MIYKIKYTTSPAIPTFETSTARSLGATNYGDCLQIYAVTFSVSYRQETYDIRN